MPPLRGHRAITPRHTPTPRPMQAASVGVFVKGGSRTENGESALPRVRGGACAVWGISAGAAPDSAAAACGVNGAAAAAAAAGWTPCDARRPSRAPLPHAMRLCPAVTGTAFAVEHLAFGATQRRTALKLWPPPPTSSPEPVVTRRQPGILSVYCGSAVIVAAYIWW